jgi:peptide/nickel transport system substrate-binding protein
MGMLSNYHSGYLVCKKAVERFGKDYAFKPVGTGFLKLNKYVPNTYSEWIAHERHWRGRPMLDSVRHMYMKDLSSREMAFRKGEVQMIQGHLSQQWYENASKLPNAEPVVIGPGLIGVLHINTTREPFDKQKVREALMHAIDRTALRKFIGKDITKPQDSPVPHDYLGSTKEIKIYAYDPDKAKKLLEEAGYPHGFDISMKISEIDDYLRPMQVIQGMLKKVGINLGLNVVTHSAYHKLTRDDANPLVIYGCSRFPTGEQILTQFYHSESIVGTPTASTNFSHFKGVDKELDAAKTETDVAKKIKLWEQAQQKIMEAAVALPLYIYQQCWVKKEWVDLGYEFTSNLEYSPLLCEKSRILAH